MLRLEGITKSFNGHPVLRGLNLEAQKGEFVTLLGASGCGKTTTLRIIAGLEEADGGRVFLDGREITRVEAHRRDVNMVFQNYALFPHMTVAANVAYSLRIKRRPREEIRRTVADALALVELSGFENRGVQGLSGGERQRVAVARALVNRPKILLLDEPLAALDLRLRRQMQMELKGLQKQTGVTFIYITHDQEEALTMSDRIAVMKDGRFEQVGSAAEVYDRPLTSYVAGFVGSANVLKGTLSPAAGGAVFRHRAGWVFAGAGAAPGAATESGVTPESEVTLAVRSEYVRFEPRDSAGGSAGAESEGLRGRISGRTFAGGHLTLTASLEGGGEITSSRLGLGLGADADLAMGREIRAVWEAERAVPVDAPGSGCGEAPP